MSYEEQGVESNAQFGDLIEFAYRMGYSHWGVYDGDGHVIHFAVPDEGLWQSWFLDILQGVMPCSAYIQAGRTKIRRQLIAEVNAPPGAHVRINNGHHAPCRSSLAEIWRRRDALLGKEFPYSLFNLNCEHCATFVRFGQALCSQIPGRPKNVECKEATELFQNVVTPCPPGTHLLSSCVTVHKTLRYEEQVRKVESNAQFGDLIEFAYPIGYSHWGVYDDDGHVIHFAVPDEGRLQSWFRDILQGVMPCSGDILLGRTKIRRQLIAEVYAPAGARVRINNGHHERCRSSLAEIQRRRNALLGKEFPYSLFNLNCEHCATFVRFGQAVCNQIPGRTKNVECNEATELFQSVVTRPGKSRNVCQPQIFTIDLSNQLL